MRAKILAASLFLLSPAAWSQIAPGTLPFAPLPLIAGNCIKALNSFQGVDAGANCGTGTVPSGTINDLAYWATSGTVLSPLATANSGVLVTSSGGVPSISSALPSGLTIPGFAPLASPTFTGTMTHPDGTTNTSTGWSFLYSGVGTTVPAGATPLNAQFWTNTAGGSNVAVGKSVTGTQGAGLNMMKSRGTLASPVTIVTGDTLGSLLAYGYDGTNYSIGAQILFNSAGTIATGQIPGTILLKTANVSGVLTTAVTIGDDQSAAVAGPVTAGTSIISGGTKFTASGCSNGTTIGGSFAGTFVSGTTGVCTVTITLNGATGATAPSGWSCFVNDETTANLMRQTASTQTTATISGTTVTSDVISFGCIAF